MSVVRDRVKEEVEILKRASIWLHKQLIGERRVTLTQFAQAARVTQPKAISVLRYMLNTLEDAHQVGLKFQIFVDGRRIPDWLGALLTRTQRAAIIKCISKPTVTVRERDMHRQVLSEIYGTGVGSYITMQYLNAEASLYESLARHGIDRDPIEYNYPQLELSDVDWALPTRGNDRAGLASHHTRPNGGVIHTNIGTYTDEVMDSINLDNPFTVELDNHFSTPNEYTEQELKARSQLINNVIEDMRKIGYGVIRTWTLRTSDGEYNTSIVFGLNNDLKLYIRYTTPWVNMVPKQ